LQQNLFKLKDKYSYCMKINNNLAIVLLLFTIVLVNYINIFSNEFVFDDNGFIIENIHTKDIKNIPEFFVEPSASNLYRPLRSVFYTIYYQIWTINTFGYHLNSLILHFFVTVLLFFITLKITEKKMFSFITSLFFASHPIHTVRVTNMTAAFDIYGILFMLLSFFFYIIFFKNKKNYYYFLSIIFYALALFSSEEAIILILILLLYDLSFNYKINVNTFKSLFKKYIPYIIVSIFYLVVRFSVLQQVGRTETYFKESFFITQLTTVKVFANYILLLFFPINLTVHRNIKSVTSVLDPYFLISLAIILLGIFLFVKSYQKSRIIFFSIGFFFITLLPFSNVFPQLTIMADRYLYLPSYGFCLFLAFLIFKFGRLNILKKYSKIIIVVFIITILSSYTFLTIQRNAEFRDNFTLFHRTIEKNRGGGTMAHVALAEHYLRIKDYDNAINYSIRAIELQPNNFYAYKNLGRISAELKNYSLAIYYYEKSLEIKPDLYQSYNNLGLIYSYIGDFDKAIFHLTKALEMNPEISKAHNDIATVYAKVGKFDLAIKEINTAIEINPYKADYYYNLVVIYEFLKNDKRAEELLLKAWELEPDNEKIKNKLVKLKS